MTTQNQNQYTVTIYVDKAAACLAGYDQHGEIERTVKPSELTPRQRQTLVDCKFTLSEHYTGAPIDGTKSIAELLERAADKIAADNAKKQKLIDEAVEKLTLIIIETSPYNPHYIDEKTGKVEFDQNNHSLIQVDALKAAKKWHDIYFFKCVGRNYFVGDQEAVDEIRKRVLSNPEVAERLTRLEEVADHIQKQLDAAKETRDRIALERREIERQKLAEAEKRRNEQLAEFVSGLDELSQRKWAADLLPESEIIERYENTIFLNLDLQFERVDRSALESEVRRYLSEGFDVWDDCDVLFIDRKPEELRDDAFLKAEAITLAVKTQYPGAKAEILLLVGYLESLSSEGDPELITPIARVTVKDGELEFSREYYLLDKGERP